MSKKPKKTDFIDLDEKEFKKKRINIKYFFLIFLIFIPVFILILYKSTDLIDMVFVKENKGIIQGKKNIEENKLNFVSKEELELLESRNKETFATIESIEVLQNNLKGAEQKMKIFTEELNKDFEELRNIQIDKPAPQILDIINGKEKNLMLYVIIDNLEERIYFDNDFLVFFNKIKSSFSENKIISRSLKQIEDLKFFNKLGDINILKNFDINIGFQQKDLINLSRSENLEDIQINSTADLKRYLINVVSGLIVISKIDSALESERNYNLDSKLDTQKKLLAAKNFFLVKNLAKSLKEIQSINEPISGNIKLLEEYLFELVKIQQIFKKLKLDVMSNDNNS